MDKQEYIKCSMKLVSRLVKDGVIDAEIDEVKTEWFFRCMALVYAFHGERFPLYDTPNVRMLHVFESYGKDDPLGWKVAAHLLYDDIGDEYSLSVYERQCEEDPFFIKLGHIFSETIKGEQ